MQSSLFVLAALGSLGWVGRCWIRMQDPEPIILVGADTSGLLVRKLTPAQDHTRVVPWPSILSVAASKIDLFSFDTIALGFQLADGMNLEFRE